MFRIESESKLLECFRPLDREEVELPQGRSFPLGVKDYLAWTEPSGAKIFLVFNDRNAGSPLGLVFRKGSAGPLSMCEWCHSVGGGAGVALLTAAATKNRRVGLHVCADLSCAEKIRGNPGVNDFPHEASEHQRIRELLERMGKFARQNLF